MTGKYIWTNCMHTYCTQNNIFKHFRASLYFMSHFPHSCKSTHFHILIRILISRTTVFTDKTWVLCAWFAAGRIILLWVEWLYCNYLNPLSLFLSFPRSPCLSSFLPPSSLPSSLILQLKEPCSPLTLLNKNSGGEYAIKHRPILGNGIKRERVQQNVWGGRV